MERKLRYGLIGCGDCGLLKHLASYAKLPEDVELCGVYDPDRERARKAAAAHGVPVVYSSWEDLLANEEIDLVSIATPNYLHAPMTIEALRRGKHVHCEKPMAMTSAEAQGMIAAKNKSGRMLMIGLNQRFTAQAVFLKRYVEEGHLGEIYHMKCAWKRRRGIPGMGGWFTDSALSGGGPLIDLGVHLIDVTLYLAGNPRPISVVGSTYSKFGGAPPGSTPAGVYNVEDLAVGFARFQDGASLALEFSWASNIEDEQIGYELYGTRGGVRVGMKRPPELKIFSQLGEDLVDIVPRIEDRSAWGENETRHFVRCIQTGTEPLATPEGAADIIRIIEGLYLSARTGKQAELCTEAIRA